MSMLQLVNDVQTVDDIASFFGELKQRAKELASIHAAQDRGYFSADEDDTIKQMLVSYWQARNALLDVIQSARADEALQVEKRHRQFTTAFTAALILIDAARFLRNEFNDRSLVVKKLNEPAPELGVPANVYDQVQKSLLNARNAWSVYFAIKYFEQHENEIREQATSEGYHQLMPIVDSLRDQLEVSVSMFAKAKLRTRSRQIARRVHRTLFGKAMYGLQKFGGTVLADRYMKRGHHPALPDDIRQQLCEVMRPGDIIVCRKEHAVTNYFLPGHWPHAALHVGTTAQLEALGVSRLTSVVSRWQRVVDFQSEYGNLVLEAMKDGVQIRDVQSPFASDSVVILRPKLTEVQMAEGLNRAFSHEGKKYDFDFDFNRSDKLVCTEVIYRAYDGVGDLRLPLERRAGRLNLSGRDLVMLSLEGKGFEPIAVYEPSLTQTLATGQEVISVLKIAEGI